MDAMGAPQSVLVLGGSSEIAVATVNALPHSRLRRVLLAGRPSSARHHAVETLVAAGVAGVNSVETNRRPKRGKIKKPTDPLWVNSSALKNMVSTA